MDILDILKAFDRRDLRLRADFAALGSGTIGLGLATLTAYFFFSCHVFTMEYIHRNYAEAITPIIWSIYRSSQPLYRYQYLQYCTHIQGILHILSILGMEYIISPYKHLLIYGVMSRFQFPNSGCAPV